MLRLAQRQSSGLHFFALYITSHNVLVLKTKCQNQDENMYKRSKCSKYK